MKSIKSASLDNFEAVSIDVESTFTKGLPSFSIVGMANTAIQESKERIKSALLTNDFKFPPKRITINLSPSEIVKKGSQIDLAIALLIALQESNVDFGQFYVFGELGLDGSLKDTKSIFVLILSLARQGLLQKVLIPIESIDKVSMIPNIDIYGVENLDQAINFFISEQKESKKISNKIYNYKHIVIDDTKYFYTQEYEDDFYDIKGQTLAKRAALIAAAGNHNILLEGSPGCGKSMISRRLPYILPPLNLNEILDIAKIESLQGKTPNFKPLRTSVSPHHSGTKASIVGGTTIGEVGIAHHGMLFFDELPHFPKSVLEALREPLQDNEISISRVNEKVKYPTKFLFMAAQNPCPCGNLLSQTKSCRCSDIEIQRYKNKISDPFIDRIDLYVIMNEITKEDKSDITSSQMHQKVIEAFTMQKLRGQSELNGKLNDKDIKKYCKLDSHTQEILDMAIEKFQLSFRSINKIIKVSRTIADLDQAQQIQKQHLIEALSYRKR
ncbi:MAG: YifB family Mg chelatase-like AAA ATPase [Campylobacterales bacterium]|nr:YifB family Mg chelatase-like AAA ATPase [Campylobacterales bacterium]